MPKIKKTWITKLRHPIKNFVFYFYAKQSPCMRKKRSACKRLQKRSFCMRLIVTFHYTFLFKRRRLIVSLVLLRKTKDTKSSMLPSRVKWKEKKRSGWSIAKRLHDCHPLHKLYYGAKVIIIVTVAFYPMLLPLCLTKP